jgi:protein-tyrosine-phosphatase
MITWADLVLVMSDSHLYAVADMGGSEKVALITDFLAGDKLGAAVEDPFGAGDDAYERTYQQLDEAIEAALARLEPILSP